MLKNLDTVVTKAVRIGTYTVVTSMVAIFAFVGFGKGKTDTKHTTEYDPDFTIVTPAHADIVPAADASFSDGDDGDGDGG